MDLISRRNAMRLGMVRYYTGKPCVNGHVSERYVGSGACVACVRESAKEFREEMYRYRENPEISHG